MFITNEIYVIHYALKSKKFNFVNCLYLYCFLLIRIFFFSIIKQKCFYYFVFFKLFLIRNISNVSTIIYMLFNIFIMKLVHKFNFMM